MIQTLYHTLIDLSSAPEINSSSLTLHRELTEL